MTPWLWMPLTVSALELLDHGRVETKIMINKYGEESKSREYSDAWNGNMREGGRTCRTLLEKYVSM